jgi:hypothetical protein
VFYDSVRSPTINRTVDNRIADELTDLCDRANLLWELQWDESIDAPRVVVARPGQRQSDTDPDLAAYDVEKDADRELSAATIYGRDIAERETVTADVGGTDLREAHLRQGTVDVRSASDGTRYQEGSDADYTINYTLGILNPEAGGDIDDGELLDVSYDWKPQATRIRPEADHENHLVETITPLTSDAACAEAAELLLDELDAPQWTAQITIPRREAGFDLLSSIAPSELPAPPDGLGYRIDKIDESAGEIRLQLGGRLSAEDIIGRLEGNIQRTQRDV